MKRRALIIYCDNTSSGVLPGPSHDNNNYRDFLESNLGGNWYENEIHSLRNPSSAIVASEINSFLNGADYTFTIFTGHGFINASDGQQYLELSDTSISLLKLRNNSPKQTLIIDACRGYVRQSTDIIKGLGSLYDMFTGTPSTRQIFENGISNAEQGWSILYSASENQTSLDTTKGAAYLSSLLKIAEQWKASDKKNSILDLKTAHDNAKTYVLNNFNTLQNATMNIEKRYTYYPFAVKMTSI